MSCEPAPAPHFAMPLLQEIREGLQRLAECGEVSAIDLRSLPLSETDRADLARRLGDGEVHIRVTAAGETRIWETAYSGVWWVRHLGAGGRLAAERIEIAPLPMLLASDCDDIKAAAERLAAALSLMEDEHGEA